MKKRAEKRKKKTKPNNNKVHDLYKNQLTDEKRAEKMDIQK